MFDQTSPAPSIAAAVRPAAERSAWRDLAGPFLLFLFAALLLRSIGLITAVIDTDEGLYIVQAREWLRGGWPLVAVWDMHPVGAPAMIAATFALFGQSIEAVRLLATACVVVTATALFALVRVGGGLRPIAVAAGLLYVAFSIRLGGLATNTEVLFAPFVTLAMLVGAVAARRALVEGQGPRWRDLIATGLLVGAGLAIKPVVTPEGCLAFALLTFPALLRRRALPPLRFVAMAVAYAGLCLLPTALFGLAYLLRGEFMAFLEGSFLAPFRYSLGRLPFLEASRMTLVVVMILMWPMVLAALAMARWLGHGGAAGRLVRTGALWMAVGAVAIAGPGFFFQHYFLIWLPPLCLLAAFGAWRLAWLARASRAHLAFAAIVGAVMVDSFLGAFVPRLDRGIGFTEPDPVREVAAAVREAIRPGETAFVANYHPAVYFLSGAEVPTRFIFPAQLTGGFERVAGIDTDEEVRRILEANPPAIVVDRGWWWSLRPTAAYLINEALEDRYDLAASVKEERGPVEVWRLHR
jgi:4-amino-4-deoxy-L-arabinose transferase-like glycosyltransferase